jgi:hypothetical protein
MSRLVSRILLSILMFPLAGMVYVVSFAVGESMLRPAFAYRVIETEIFVSSGAVTWLFVGVYWCLLWRRSIRWSSRRVMGTILSAVGAAGVGVAIGVLTVVVVVSVGDGSFGAFVGGVATILLWLIATVFRAKLSWNAPAVSAAQVDRRSPAPPAATTSRASAKPAAPSVAVNSRLMS